jgi:putative PIN family toxin of toxin-antitoxin system
MIIVLDTNILVSALLSPLGKPAQILDMVLAGDATLAVDDRLLAEYQEVLARPRFAFDVEDVNTLLEYIRAEAIHVQSESLHLPLPDLDDLMFLEVAKTIRAILITGNLRHFPGEHRAEVPVLSPTEFLSKLED